MIVQTHYESFEGRLKPYRLLFTQRIAKLESRTVQLFCSVFLRLSELFLVNHSAAKHVAIVGFNDNGTTHDVGSAVAADACFAKVRNLN